MNNRNTGIIATIVTAVLCGCPGLFSLCWGAIASFAGLVPGSEIDIGGSSDPRAALYTGIGALCLGVILVAIPIVVGFLTLRRKPSGAIVAEASDEPLPPPG